MFELSDEINSAANLIKDGGIVLFPTETVYGIGANGLNDTAVKRIFEAKGRAQDNPLILHISDMEMLEQVAENVSDLEYRLMENFWPGPFTIVLNKKRDVANVATCGGETVGVRMPSNKIAHDLIKASGCPIAAPSANVSGKPSGTKVADIIDELKDRVDFIIDGGECEIGIESTVVRVIDDEVRILRPGKITKEDIELVAAASIDKNVLGSVGSDEKVLSPGMKYRHYAPTTKCKLVYSSDNEQMVEGVLKVAKSAGRAVIVSSSENLKRYEGFDVIDMGSRERLIEISHNIFSVLRRIDECEADVAVIEGVQMDGLGLAIMNRLIRACEHEVLFCGES